MVRFTCNHAKTKPKKASAIPKYGIADALIFCMRLFPRRLYDGADHFFEFRTRHHDEVAASLTFETEIHAGAQDFPGVTAAGVGFFHADDVADLIFSCFHG